MDDANKWLAHLPSFVNKLIVTTIPKGETRKVSEKDGIAFHHWGYDVFNFSDARNHALSLVKTDWAIMLDIDERLQIFKEDVSFIESLPKDVYGAKVRLNCFTNEGDCGGTYEVTRIMRKQVKYRYYCHETVTHWIEENGFRIVASPLTIRHDSYSDKELLPIKLQRNYHLILDNIEADRDNRYDPKLIGDLYRTITGLKKYGNNN